MTHQRVLQLAGCLCEHAAPLVDACRGVPTRSLRRYQAANDRQFQSWSAALADPSVDEAPQTLPWRDRIASVLEVATSGVLLRVAGTVLESIGRQLSIPFATDVAARTVRNLNRARAVADAAAACQSDGQPAFDSIRRFTRRCDCLSDLLCGALIPRLQCDRYVLDRERAADFAETFGCRPCLVRIPVRQVCRMAPTTQWSHGQVAEKIERAIVGCLPRLFELRSGGSDLLSDLAAICRKPTVDVSVTTEAGADRACAGGVVAFPTLSFSRLRRPSGSN